jgi:hypothetical protein
MPVSNSTQAADERWRLVWSPINHIPHRDLAALSAFVVLSTVNGTTLTLSDGHMVYLSDVGADLRTPAPARDVKVRV